MLPTDQLGDNTFIIWSIQEEALRPFLQILNSLNSKIQFTEKNEK